MKNKEGSFIWGGSAAFILFTYLLFLVYPVSSLLKQSIMVANKVSFENFITFFSKSYFNETLINSFKVSFMATVFSLIIGTVLAYLFTMYQFKGKSVLQILIIIASMSAPFVGAYSWILLLGRSGVVSQLATNLFGIKMFDIYGFTGIVMVFTLQLFPLIFLYVLGAFKNIDNSILEAAEGLGTTGLKRMYQVILPLLLPTISAGALLVFMRAFSDFGTPMLIGEGYRTFPVLIYTEFMSEVGGNEAFASSLAVIAIIIALIIFLGQKYVTNKNTFKMSALHKVKDREVAGLKRVVVYLISYGVVFLAILPQIYLIYTSFLNTKGMVFKPGYSLDSYRQAFDRTGSAILNSIRIPLIAIILVVIFSIFIAYLTVKKKSWLTELIDILSMIPYVVPGTVLGVAFLAAFNTGVGGTGVLAITGTLVIIIISLTVRRLPYTVRSSVASISQIPDSIEEAASSLGSSSFNTFVKIIVPMMLSGVISGAILSWITMLSELSTSVLLYNVNTKTMPVAIYTEVIRGNYGIAAALSTILTAMTVISLLLFMKLTHSKELTM
ncbi:iron ABC transporter permease [Vagococcus coleopterorum]|uniref:Iron ABC transporter permease n=1 Tax=Vagococcus coleopterorum TaxID=2714946 RepID=A0A6G8AL07_9ENTE|nr:iron ABC transporter permease [Vagococcus coleopterorum]QIL45660.1 iron ABC transporter permease [Vagococcus coleopterorum]